MRCPCFHAWSLCQRLLLFCFHLTERIGLRLENGLDFVLFFKKILNPDQIVSVIVECNMIASLILGHFKLLFLPHKMDEIYVAQNCQKLIY